MKKVLLAFDGSNFSVGAFDFVRRLNEIQPILLTGVFVPQVDYANLWSYSAAIAATGSFYIPMVEEEEAVLVENNIHQFERLCKENKIQYRIHKDFFDFVLPELKKESRFADVMIISGELFYKHIVEADQYDYIKDLMHSSECPVVVVPERYDFPDNNIIAYDGSAEAVYALKQFSYIFPTLAKNPTLLAYAEDQEDSDFPSKDHIIELATQHFDDLTFYKLEKSYRKKFGKWMSDKKGSILVSGSFSRSPFSEMFRRSFVADIIKEHQVPVFVAHRR